MLKVFFVFIILVFYLNAQEDNELIFKEDNSSLEAINYLHPKSHIKIFLPSIPYIYISKNTNAGLIRSSDN